MKKTITLRRFLTIATITDITAIFVLLSIPGVLDRPGTLSKLTILLALAPLLVIAAFISYIVSRSPQQSNQKFVSKKITVITAAITAASLVLSVIFTVISAHIYAFDEHHNKFAYENVGTGLLFLAYIAAMILVSSQQYVYWPFWSRSERAAADERQKSVRQRVFEKAYRYQIVTGLALLLLRVPGERHTDQVFVWSFALILIALPAVIAAQERDS